MDRTARCKLGLVAVLVAVMGVGCDIDVGVGVDVTADGSGEVEVAVTLDRDAAGRVSDLAGQLRVDDLRAAGWVIDGPTPGPDGSVELSATKPFSRVDDAGAVLEEISGVEGPFQGFLVSRQRSFFATTYHLDGVVALDDGIEGFSDEALRQRLEGSGFGLGTAQVEQLTGEPLADTFHFDVRVRLPGKLVEGPPAGGDDEVTAWSPEVGETTVLAASSRQLHTARLAWLAAACAAMVALVAVLVARRRGR